MDFNDTPEEAAFRKQVRAWLEANAPKERRPADAGMDDRTDMDASPGLAGARRPRPATPASPGPRNGAAAAARPWQQVIFGQEEAHFDSAPAIRSPSAWACASRR